MTDRSNIALFNEGQLLTLAAQRDVAMASEHARGMIDGCFNAIIRFEGPEKAAEFAFAIVDRVSGGIKGTTPWPRSEQGAPTGPLGPQPSADPQTSPRDKYEGR